MTRSSILIAITLTLLVSNAAGQYDYQKKGYVPPPISGATRCVKNAGTGNTPNLCPGAVPLTDEGKPGSTQCVTAVNGTSYEGVLSLFYPAPNAVPWCTTDAQCGSTPGIICATPGPTGSGNVCIPLAPAACPYPASDQVNITVTSTVAAAGRKLLSV